MKQAFYEKDQDKCDGFYQVKFLIRETGKVLVRGFDSPYFARVFVNKLNRSKKCTLISYPSFE